MAKLEAKEGTTATGDTPRRDKASEAEAQLRAYHALGRKVLDRLQGRPLDAATLLELDAQTGYGFDNLRKARVFATRYTPRQLDELCRLRTPAGRPLPWRHVRQLLMLPPGEGRDALQRKAAERGWSLEELAAAIPRKVRRGQTRRGGGRSFRGPRSLADALRQIARHGDEWLRRFGSEAWAGDDWLGGKVGAAVWPEELRGKLRVSADLGRHLEWLRGDVALGFDALYLHPIDPDPEAFLDAFGERVLPALAG
jgi:hypothetical protein